jgi:Zn-dependent protease/CBS domain-containing protein
MKWSWKIGTLTGIELRIHVTFLLLLGWVGASHWIAGRSVDAALNGMAFILALFGCVLLHELGHSLAARRYGIPTRDITLLPIGGVARLERMPEKPSQELVVALAGPAVNVAIAAVLFAWLSVAHEWAPVGQMQVASGPFLERLLIANVWLVLFNLIPAFPMDGGRVLRALLASRMEYVRATQIAAGVGQGLAFVFGLIGLFGNPMLLFIALFVWIGASQEASATQMRAAMAGTPIRAAMLTDFRHLDGRDKLAHAVRLILEGSQQDFPVIEGGRVAGILTRTDLLLALAEHGPDYPVASTMRRDFLTTDYTEMLEVAFQRLQECNCHTMPVIHEGCLAGLVTMDNLGEYFLIQAALKRSDGRPRPASGLERRAAGTA